MPDPMDDIAQQRRTVRALELLGESHAAFACGDLAACDALADKARRDCGDDTVTLLLGGMQIGEIPRPAQDEWPHFLAGQIVALTRNELQRRPEPGWDCQAYGRGQAAFGALCFVSGKLGARKCADLAECRRVMDTERQRVFRRINELAAGGDDTGTYLAGEFTSPGRLLGGGEEEDPTGEGRPDA